MTLRVHRAMIGLVALTSPILAFAAAPGAPDKPVDADLQLQAAQLIEPALRFLATTQQPDGGWKGPGDRSHPAISALAVMGFIRSPQYGPRHEIVQRALRFIRKSVQEDGGIYVEGEGHENYHTSVCLMALAAAGDLEDRPRVGGAQRFLCKLQWDEEEGYERDHSWYGGAGYTTSKRPDLSNTQLMIEALYESGLPTDHPAYRKAQLFIRRCQMSGVTNDQSFANLSSDGGFVYTAANGGESKAGTEWVEGRPRLRTYGSMTYAGFKSLLYAQVSRDDPRVIAALRWIREHHTLDRNPNMPGAQSQEGLYYYYYVFAKALRAWGEDVIIDAAGREHDWRRELCEALRTRQRADGSFVNPADRWLESNPYLVTAYAVIALQATLDRAPTPAS